MIAKAKIVEDVVEFMASLVTCVGEATEFASTGYDWELAPGTVSMSLGLSTGSMQALEDLLSKKPPRAFISLDFGFSVGTNSKLYWAGVGMGGSLDCLEKLLANLLVSVGFRFAKPAELISVMSTVLESRLRFFGLR